MSKKVKLAIVDKDLKARTVKKYPVSDSGEQIRIVSGGEGHFMPYFDNESFIEFPSEIGKEKQQFPVWILYVTLLAVIGIAMKVFGMI